MGWAEECSFPCYCHSVVDFKSAFYSPFCCFVKDGALFRTVTHFEDFIETFGAECGFDWRHACDAQIFKFPLTGCCFNALADQPWWGPIRWTWPVGKMQMCLRQLSSRCFQQERPAAWPTWSRSLWTRLKSDFRWADWPSAPKQITWGGWFFLLFTVFFFCAERSNCTSLIEKAP